MIMILIHDIILKILGLGLELQNRTDKFHCLDLDLHCTHKLIFNHIFKKTMSYELKIL